MEKLREKLLAEKGPAYFFVYWSSVDEVEHSFGPNSKEHVSELKSFSNLVVKRLLDTLKPSQVEDTLFLLSSDHGQVSIKGEDIIFLNSYLELAEKYARMDNKEIIPPTGAPHDVFLFIQPQHEKAVLGLLRKELDGKAKVLTTKQAREKGLFGLGETNPKFLKRIGNILILPMKNRHVWYDHFPGQVYPLKGVHGGLSPEEMTVPFAVCDFAELVSG